MTTRTTRVARGFALGTMTLAMLAGCTATEIYVGFLEVNRGDGGGGASSSTTAATGGTGGALLCTPGAVQSCYDGPAGTEGVGLCKAGMQTCAADGMSWGACTGEVLPKPEDCATPVDDDCDGMAPACKGSLLWAKRFGDATLDQEATSIAVDASGNVVVAGYVNGSVDFGGGTLTSEGLADVFVAKLDPDGHYLWAKLFGDSDNQTAASVAVDGAGNVLVTGSFYGSIDFGGGALTSAGYGDVFVAKLDPDGHYLWAKSFGDSDNQTAASVAVDGAGNVLVTGSFYGSIDFGGGAHTSAGYGDVFVAKLDPDGHCLWAKSFGDANDQTGASVAADTMGNALVAGSFFGSMEFGSGTITSGGGRDVFVVKLDPGGTPIWFQGFGDASDQVAVSVATDSSGSALLTGYFSGSVNFGSGLLTNTGAGRDVFVAKLDADGGSAWSRGFGDPSDQAGTSIAVDTSGKVVLTGHFAGQMSLGGAPLASVGGEDIFLGKLGADGGHQWSERFGDSSNQFGTSVAVDHGGNVLLAGYFFGSVDLGGGPLMSAGGTDILVAKFSP